MSLNLYRRHCEQCKAGRAPEFRSGEFEERKKDWKRCDCSIFVSGTLEGKFKRKSTGVSSWDEAKAIIADWKSWKDEFPVPIQPPLVQPATPAKITIDKAIKDFLADHEGDSADSTVRDYRYLLNHFNKVSVQSGFVVLEQWGPAQIRKYRKSWKVAAGKATKKVAASKATKKMTAGKATKKMAAGKATKKMAAGKATKKMAAGKAAKEVAASTATKKMAILKTFFEFCLSNEWISRNPARLVRQKHNRNEDEEKERVPFTDEELTRMYQACETSYGKGVHEYRYRWSGEDLEDFISVSIYTGLRISDVATFHADRLLKSGECHIRTTKKGKKVNTWIPEWLQKRIRERARRYGPRIFGTSDSPNNDVITDLWRRKLKRLWSLCGPWEAAPVHHRFRHTFVRILLQTDGVEVREVAELIGDTEESVRKHYSAWVPELQARVTKVLREAFANKPKPNFLTGRKNEV